MSVSLLVALFITTIMSAGSIRSNNVTVLDNMQIMARIGAQNISSNLHLLAERMYNFSTEPVFLDETSDVSEKQKRFDAIRLQIEFVWLSAYDTEGRKLCGDDTAPDSIADTGYYSFLSQTKNTVIGEPCHDNDILQLCVGIPLKKEDTVIGYLVGSYKYDLLNDVISQLVPGDTGSACILNEDGFILGDHDTSNVIERRNIYEMYPGNKEKFDSATAFQTGSSQIKLGSVTHYAGYAPIPGTNWALMVHAPRREFMDTAVFTTLLSIVFSALLLLAAAAVIAPVSKRISDPLSAATRRLQALAAGNLTDKVILSDSHDETGILTDALSKTVDSLKAYIQEIETSLSMLSSGDYTVLISDRFQGDFSSIRDSLTRITDALNRTMQQMNQSSMEVSDCARQLLDGSDSQTLLLKDMEENMDAITISIEKNKDNAIQMEECTRITGEKTALGGSYMQKMLTAMSEIHASVEEISKVSLLIENISRQTNLLSLNASVEAARAGEAGRGFAVVAQEISTLSGQTADALQETGNLITHSAETIKSGLKTATQTAETFEEIANLTKRYGQISIRLSETVNEQTTAVSSANDRLRTLRDIAGKNQEMAAESLSQAKRLRDYVARAKIRQ